MNNNRKNKKVYITTPIFYPNAELHLGSTHTLSIADFLTRAFRTIGYDVFFLTGTDEHCEKVEKAAAKKSMLVQNFVDEIVDSFKMNIKKIDIEYDRFLRTSDDDHKQKVQEFWKYLEKKQLIYKGKYEGYYSVADETFFKESDLIDGKAPTGAEVRKESVDAYFFKCSQFQSKLEELFEKDFTTPKNRINELKGYISEGLFDLCISRKNTGWGIPVPNDEQYLVYVWFDALTNYFNACDTEELKEYWNGRVIHIVGKDIAVFHGVFWPVMLMASDRKMFDDLLVHNWWLVKEEKMSKSKGNVISPSEIIAKYSANLLRFYCIKENLIKNDGSFDEKKMIDDFNAFAVGKFSNLVYRLWTILHRNDISIQSIGEKTTDIEARIIDAIENLDINDYFDAIFNWCDSLNQRIEHHKAWKDVEIAKTLFSEMKVLIKYFEPIFPSIQGILNSETPQIIFHSIKTANE